MKLTGLNWQDLVELANKNETIKLEEHTIDANLELKKPNMFEEIVDEDYTNTLVQNILSLEHVIDNNDKSLTIAFGKGFNLLDYFVMHILKNIIFQHYFMGIQDHHLHGFIKRLCKQK
jgi:hypothetical protein